MNVDATIVVDEAADAVAVPIASVQRGNTVYVKDDSAKNTENAMVGGVLLPDGWRAVEVETGLSDDSYIEITSGIEPAISSMYPRCSATRPGDEFGMLPGGDMGNMPSGSDMGGMGGMPSGGGMAGGGMPGRRRYAVMTTETRTPLIELRDIYKIYQMGDTEVHASGWRFAQDIQGRICSHRRTVGVGQIDADEHYWLSGRAGPAGSTCSMARTCPS